jgi:4-hydroxybenzoate polyprenyltransferase
MRNLDLLERHVHRPVASTRSSRRFVALLAVLIGCCVVGAIALLVWLVHLLLTRPVL